MPRFATLSAGHVVRRLSVAALLAATTFVASTTPSSAFVETLPGTALHDSVDGGAYGHGQSPAGANVIGRGVGGLHGRLAARAAAAPVDDTLVSCAQVASAYNPSGAFLGDDGDEASCR